MSEIWRKVLDQISTQFGKLVFLSSLLNAETGRYSHSMLLNYMGAEEVDRTIRQSHHQIFQRWLGFSLMEQKADLDDYLAESRGPRYALPYRKVVPPNARDVERQLYLTDLETLLELLRFEPGSAFATPES